MIKSSRQAILPTQLFWHCDWDSSSTMLLVCAFRAPCLFISKLLLHGAFHLLILATQKKSFWIPTQLPFLNSLALPFSLREWLFILGVLEASQMPSQWLSSEEGLVTGRVIANPSVRSLQEQFVSAYHWWRQSDLHHADYWITEFLT
jgi:hypothetical protein